MLTYGLWSLLFYQVDCKYRKSVLPVYRKVLQTVSLNLFVLYPALVGLCMPIIRGIDSKKDYKYLFLFALVFDVAFTFGHKCLHLPFLFKRIHFKHHEMTTDTIAFGALYCHPLEFVFGNFLPTFLPLLLTRPHHNSVIKMWCILVASGICITHAGYGGSHIKHHKYKTSHFGIFESPIDFLLSKIPLLK